MSLVRDMGCGACGGRHQFCLPPVDPIADEYGYVCPATGRVAAVRAFGPWKVFAARPRAAITLVPLGTSPLAALGMPPLAAVRAHA